MVGRTPANIIAVRPLRDGVISDFDVTEQMIRYFIDKVHDRVGLIPRPRMVIGIPSGVTEVEKRAVHDAALNAGARWARLIEEPMAAAIGAGLPVVGAVGLADRRHRRRHHRGRGDLPRRHRRQRARSASAATRWTRTSSAFARREYNLLIGERTAEEIKIAIGSAYPGEWDAQRSTLRGRDLLTGLPRGRRGRRRPDPRGDRVVGRADRRRHQGHDRGDAAGARGRHHGPGHRAGRRRRAAGRPRPARRRGDPDAGPRRRRPADLRGARHRRRARGAGTRRWSGCSSPTRTASDRADAAAAGARSTLARPRQP